MQLIIRDLIYRSPLKYKKNNNTFLTLKVFLNIKAHKAAAIIL